MMKEHEQLGSCGRDRTRMTSFRRSGSCSQAWEQTVHGLSTSAFHYSAFHYLGFTSSFFVVALDS